MNRQVPLRIRRTCKYINVGMNRQVPLRIRSTCKYINVGMNRDEYHYVLGGLVSILM